MHESQLYFRGFLFRKEHQVLEVNMETDSWSPSENKNFPLEFLNLTCLEPQQVMEIETMSHSSRQKMSFSQPKRHFYNLLETLIRFDSPKLPWSPNIFLSQMLSCKAESEIPFIFHDIRQDWCGLGLACLYVYMCIFCFFSLLINVF